MENASALPHIVPAERMRCRRERDTGNGRTSFHHHHGTETGGKRFDDLAEDDLFISSTSILITPLLKPALRSAANLPSSHCPAS